jgi:hypothetical protein
MRRIGTQALVLFQSPPAAQGVERRPGNTTDHNTNDDALASDVDGAIIGTQATDASDDGNNDVFPHPT